MLLHKFIRIALRLPQGEFDHYVQVDDRRSPVTVFAFAGAAGLFGLTPAYEFRRLLSQRGNNYNLVFFRDLQALCYHLTPKGEPGGLDFYAREVQTLIAQLGSTYNVAVGNSAGGGAALYFGARCGMNQVIAFAPFLPQKGELGACLRAVFDLPLLFRSPTGYSQWLLGLSMYRKITRTGGPNALWPVLDMWRGGGKLPKAAIYYGGGCYADRLFATQFAETGRVECVALPIKAHGAARYLREQGKLGDVIIDRIEKDRLAPQGDHATTE